MDSETLDAYLSGELDEARRSHVEHALRNDDGLRKSYTDQLAMDAALRILLDPSLEPLQFNQGVMAAIQNPSDLDTRKFSKSVLTEIVEEQRQQKPSSHWRDMITAGIISAAAAIAIMFGLQMIAFGPQSEAPLASAEHHRTLPARYVARLESHQGELTWAPATLTAIREDGWLTPGLLELVTGSVLIGFNSGASVVIEGPAQFSIESDNRIFVHQGKVTAEVPPPATGFTVNTPRMNAVDIGTRFGVYVGADGVSELHVMEGEVELSRNSGMAAPIRVKEGLSYLADSRPHNGLAAIPYQGDSFLLQIPKVNRPLPILQYHFDESFGPVMEDRSPGTSYDISLLQQGRSTQSPRRAVGKNAGGLIFQDNHFLPIPLPSELGFDSPSTFAFWIKLQPKLERIHDQPIARLGPPEHGLTLTTSQNSHLGARGALKLQLGDAYLTGSTDITDGAWHHIACRFLGGESGRLSTHVHLYVDGRLETPSECLDATLPSGNIGALLLGDSQANGLHGWVDEVVVFNEAISTLEIQMLKGDKEPSTQP